MAVTMREPRRLPGALRDGLRDFRTAVLDWYERERRDLPFRRTRDPYLILVSEAMAQQTQVQRVGPAWERFVAAFPTVDALAAASLDAVLRAWAGLGYNRRAVHLHRAARAIVAEHAGRVPSDPSRLEALPGVGPYTARAVAAIAFDQPVGAVDTNVRRVLSRTAGVDPADRAAVQALADALVPPDRAADWTAALMDVGTRHCRPMPVCDGCPVSPWCATRSARAAAPAGGPTGRARRPSPPFESTSRWLRGRIVSFLCAAPPGAWVRLDRPIGTHPPEAVAVALATLARDGLVELDPDDAAQARLATG